MLIQLQSRCAFNITLTSLPRIQVHLKLTKSPKFKNTYPHEINQIKLPPMKEKMKITSSTSKPSITICEVFKECFGSFDRQFLGIQCKNLGNSSAKSSKSCGPILKYSYIQIYKNQQLSTTQISFAKYT